MAALELREVDVRAAPARHRLVPHQRRKSARSNRLAETGRPRPARGAPRDASRAAVRRASRAGRRACSSCPPASERERPPRRVAHGGVAGDDVPPGRRERILEAAHEDARARVEGIDDHLRVGRARQLDAPVVEIGGRGGTLHSDSRSSRVSSGNAGRSPAAKRPRARRGRQQGAPPGAEAPLELADQRSASSSSSSSWPGTADAATTAVMPCAAPRARRANARARRRLRSGAACRASSGRARPAPARAAGAR